MLIGVPRECRPGQAIVAATPRTVTVLLSLGHEVVVEHGAGQRATLSDDAYAAAGATVAGREQVCAADLVIKVDAPTPQEIALLRPEATLAALLAPARSPDLVQALAERGVTALAMDAVPRISRAQSLDVLSSMANLSGYRAVIEAAHEFGGMFAGQVTAAGKTPPAVVFVVGAGVAGLAAIGAAQSLGAVVRAFDVRPEVAEQVESMGARFVRVDAGAAEQRADGYATELSGDLEAAARALYDEEARKADVVITTALIPGRPAPRLVTAQTVAAMRPGSVVVDLAAAAGGNVEGTRADERVVSDNGVVILGWTDLAGRMPAQASQLYGTNMVNLVRLLTPPSGGGVSLDLADPVLRGMAVTRDGAVLWPPPPVPVSTVGTVATGGTVGTVGTPVGTTGAGAATPAAGTAAAIPGSQRRPDPRRRTYAVALLAVLAGVGAALSPPDLRQHLTVFALAVVAGYYVISHVTHALHTPLMSVTNAISGIILVGALLQVGSTNLLVTVLSLGGITVASINIFGGFLVTHRMLGMFRAGGR